MIDETYIKAGHAETLPDELCRLARHPAPAIRRRVAENHNTPLSSLQGLAADPEPDVRVALVFHPAIPFDLLLRLAEDECADVRYELAETIYLPLKILDLLAQDDNPYVAFRARRTLFIRGQCSHGTRQAAECSTIDSKRTMLGREDSNTQSSASSGMVNVDGRLRERKPRSMPA